MIPSKRHQSASNPKYLTTIPNSAKFSSRVRTSALVIADLRAHTLGTEVMGLLEQPAWKAEDLGKPLPDSEDACSVALPTWDSVIGYEEGHERILKKLRCGYPRFLINDKVKRLFAAATAECASDGEEAIVFPTREIAQRAQRYVELKTNGASRIVSYEGLHALVVGEKWTKLVLEYWRYTGEVTSSRRAGDTLEGSPLPPDPQIQTELTSRLAQICGAPAEDVYLFESGMAAIFTVHRALTQIFPGKKTLQMEFPYVDAMRVQQNFGSGVVYLNTSDGEDCDEALQRIRRGEFAAVFCEVASNPLMRCINVPEVSAACRAGGCALIIDDTVSSSYNVDVLKYADAVTTSLTKWISGKGNVMAGQLVLNSQSPLYNDLQHQLEPTRSAPRLYPRDAIQLLENLESFPDRIQQINANGAALFDLLSSHPNVASVWYTKSQTLYRYEDVRKTNGGYGGLISFLLKGGEKRSQKFYDALKLTKGPGLGTDFTLVCPYTLLAHYDDLEWAEACGVPRNLIRVSSGIENTGDLIANVTQALETA